MSRFATATRDGPRIWSRLPEARQTPIATSMNNVERWARALFSEPTPLQAFRSLNVPVLYMLGAHSPASSRGVARLLRGTLANVTVMEFADLGHIGPVTHPEVVNDAVAGFLART